MVRENILLQAVWNKTQEAALSNVNTFNRGDVKLKNIMYSVFIYVTYVNMYCNYYCSFRPKADILTVDCEADVNSVYLKTLIKA